MTDKQSIPMRVKHFIFPEETEDLFKKVEDYNNYANYSLDMSFSSRSVLNALKDVTNMLSDPICSSAVKCVMQTAFQPNNDGKLFVLNTPYEAISQELKNFHEDINAENVILITAYNMLLWGQLPWKHFYNGQGVLERVSPIPDFTAITPVIVSGRVVGFLNEEGNYVPSYEYTYSQLDFYKNLGGNSQNMYVSVGGNINSDDNITFRNEFQYTDSYLSSASKPWRSVNVIEDGLLLNRMDQSNYYRIISVNVGGQVYSKSAIQVLNYYRNLFKKVRRINYDSNGMSSRGNGQEFEVIVPQTQNQGVSIQNVGGDVDIKALKDLDTQYQKLFAALQIQPSMIGFSSDTPSSLGDSAAITWDKRFAKVCKTLAYSTFRTLKNIDYYHLRSLGYNVSMSDWSYRTVSQTMMEDADKGETLKLASDNLSKISEVLRNMDAEYDKEYLAKTLLGDALSNYGIDTEKLFSKKEDIGVPEDGSMMIGTSFRKGGFSSFKREILSKDTHIMSLNGMLDDKTSKEIISAVCGKSGSDSTSIISEKVVPLTLRQMVSSSVVKRDNPLDLEGFVVFVDEDNDEITSKYKLQSSEGDGVPFKFPIYCSKDIEITAGDLDMSGNRSINNLFVDSSGNHYLTSKMDVCSYLYNYMSGSMDNYVANVWKRNSKFF